MKWKRPGQGHCLQCVTGGYRYVIQDDYKEGLWYLSQRPAKKSVHVRFDTYAEMYKHITGSEPEERKKEREIREEIIWLWTKDAGAGASLREYSRDGQSYAVDPWQKEVWPFWLPEKISGYFNTERECREWADEYLEEKYGQLDFFGGMR